MITCSLQFIGKKQKKKKKKTKNVKVKNRGFLAFCFKHNLYEIMLYKQIRNYPF